MTLRARLKKLRKKSRGRKCERGLKPVLIPDTLRGAEAPLFHVTARIPELFRSL
jgi:hypothetical protein